MNFRIKIDRVLVVCALLFPACSTRKNSNGHGSSPVSPTPTSNSNAEQPKSTTEGKEPSNTSNNSLSVLKLRSIKTVNGYTKSYLILAVRNSPDAVSEIVGIHLRDGSGKSVDVTSESFAKKTFYGAMSKEALVNSGYFSDPKGDDASDIEDVLKNYESSKLLVISPIPAVFMSKENEESNIILRVKLVSGSEVEK